MARIAICSPNIEAGDAVSNDVFGMQSVLIDQGHEVSLFVQDCSIAGIKVRPVGEITYFLEDSNDILIYHYAIGWDFGLKLLKDLNCRKVIKFHNVTPPEFYEGISADYVNVCRAGRQQLRDLARTDVDLYLPCSKYSQNDLVAAGVDVEKCRVVPPFHNIERLRGIDANLKEIERYQEGTVNILTVGRLAPNKNHEALIDAYAVYCGQYNQCSRLFIVGGQDPKLRAYVLRLQNKAREKGLEGKIVFTGKATDSALKTYYLVSHVFLMTSLHEGFCVPLVEAMSMKIPIVAYNSTAVPETLGKGGLVWDECDPELLAASIDKIVQEEYLQIALGEIGWNRYNKMFTNGKIAATFLESLKDIL